MRQIIAGLAVSGLMVCGAGLVLAGTNPPGIDEPLKTGLTAPGDVAVVIGNEDYYKIADVPYAKADAAAFETFLTYTRGVPLDRIRSLRDVSKEEMLAAVQEMAAKKPTGIFWIYYAGHGMGDPNSADAKAPDRLLLGGDASGGAAQLASGGASVKALQAAAAAGGGQVVMVVDACYNGGTRADTGEGTGLTGGARIAVPASLVTQAGVIEWAASAPTQLALPLASVGHGAFTYLALGALRGWADGERSGSRDGLVTLEEAQTYVQRQFSVMQLTSQQPQVSGGAALSVALSGKAGARLETGPPPEVVRGLTGGASKAPPATVTASTTAPVTASTTQARPWTAADDAVIAGMIEAEKSRIVDTVREAQEAEVPQIVAVRRQSVAEEWEELKAVFGDPAEASAAGIAAVEQKIAEWKQDVARPAARRATLMGSVSWNGRTQQLSGTMEVPGQAVPVSHPETVRAAEAWVAAARAQKPAAGSGAGSAGAGSAGAGSGGSDWTSPTLGVMKWIKPGTFVMGSPAGEAGHQENETQHRVTLTKGFWLMEHEVTQGEWQAVTGSNPSKFTSCGSTCPVENVSWDDIKGYIQKVSARDGVAYRLPTEAEWEYAARGGQEYIYAGSNDLKSVAWYWDNREGNKTQPVCGKKRNEYGLCDMSGNVWEWVQDWYTPYLSDATDPVMTTLKYSPVIRGGGWYSNTVDPRVAYRKYISYATHDDNLGFRLARAP